MSPFNSSYDDFSIAIASDLKNGFFSSNRRGGKGNDDIYAFKRGQAPAEQLLAAQESGIRFTGVVRDKTNGQPLKDAYVFVLNTRTNKATTLLSDSEGRYGMPAEKGVLYVSKAVKSPYIDDCLNFRIPGEEKGPQYTIPRDLLLDKLEVNKSFVVENIYYDLDEWFIREDAKPALDNLAYIMRNNPIRAELSSHTDSRASHGYNEELSQKRAEAAIRYLILQGIDPSRLIAKGYGETRLINNCADGVDCSESQHQLNRRTEFKVIAMESQKQTVRFDPSVFRVGEQIDVYMFDPDFFRQCFLTVPQQSEPTAAISSERKQSEPIASINPMAVLPSEQTNIKTGYGVQIMSKGSQATPDNKLFANLTNVKVDEYLVGNVYKYVVGCEGSRKKAEELRQELIKLGFRNPFIVKIENGQYKVPGIR